MEDVTRRSSRIVLALVKIWRSLCTSVKSLSVKARRKSAGQAQRCLSADDQINNLFHLRRDHVTGAEHRAARTQTFRCQPDRAFLNELSGPPQG
jgi:putative transposase